MADDANKIQIDSDWKAQAQAEKQKLAEAEQKQKEETGPEGGEIPPADLEGLIQMLATNALLSMGAIPDPQTGQRYAHLGLARHHIDMIGVLEEKTKGNLTEEEATNLSSALYELRNAYVRLQEAAKNMPPAPAPGSPAPGSAPGTSGSDPLGGGNPGGIIV